MQYDLSLLRSSCRMSHFQTPPPLPVHLKKGNTKYILCTIRGGLALPPLYGNSCDPTHDISYRDPTVLQKI